MLSAAFLVLTVLAHVYAEAPPIPYAAVPVTQPMANDRLHSAPDQYVDHLDHFGTDAFNVQPGYEGYLLPGAADHGVFPVSDGIDFKGHHGILAKFFRNFLSLGWKVLPKVAAGAVALVALFLVGGCVNALVCSFTPLCSISFHGIGVTKDTMRSYLTPDRISTTATFVMDAIKKYKDMYETISNEIEAGKLKK